MNSATGTDDAAFYDRALRRMDRIAMVLGILTALTFLIRAGWRDGSGCAAAAAASVYNLRRVKRLAASLDPGNGQSRSSTAAVGLGARYILLLGGCSVIINYLGVSLPAVFAGLLVSVAAVLVEIVYELIFTYR